MTLNILALAKQVEELVKNGGGSGGTSDYEQLSKKPKINNHTLIGNKSAHDLGLATEEAVSGKSTVTANPEGTSSGDLSSIGINGTKYNIPSGGSDVPDPTGQANYQIIGTRNGAYQLFDPNTLVRTVPSGNAEDVGKVLTKYGEGSNQYGWRDAQGGNSEVTIFDGDIEVDSASTGTGWFEIPAADRIELFDSNILKYDTMHVEISFKRQVTNRKVASQNFSVDIDLKKILVDDAQNYTDSDKENNQVFLDFLYRASENMRFNFTLNFNEYLTDPSNDVYTGRLQGLFFENKTLADNTSTAFAVEQKVRVKITAK